MTFIPSGGGSQAIIQATPEQNVVTKSFTSRGAVLPGEQVDLLSNGSVQGQVVPGSPTNNFISEGTVSFENLFFDDVNTTRSCVTYLGGGQYVVCGQSLASTNSFNIIPFKVVNNSIIVGSSITNSVGTVAEYPQVTKINSTEAALAIGGNTSVNIVVFSVVDNSASVLSQSSLPFGTVGRTSTCLVSSDKIVAVAADSDDPSPNDEVKVVAGTISGGSISWGTPVDTGFDGTSTLNNQMICKLDTDKFLIVLPSVSGASQSSAAVGTVTGTSISLGSLASSSGVSFPRSTGVTQLAIDEALVLGEGRQTIKISVSGTTPTWGTTDTTLLSQNYESYNSIGFVNQLPLGTKRIPFISIDSPSKIAIWDFSATTPTKVEEVTIEGSITSIVYASCDLNTDDGLYVFYSSNDITILTENTLTESSALILDTSSKTAPLSTTRAFTYDATNIQIISIASPMRDGSVLDTDAHSMAGTLQNISKVSSSIAVFSSINAGAINLKACENVADATNLGALASFGSGVTGLEVAHELVVYTDASQIAMRGLSYSSLTITEGAEVQLEASVPSSFNIAKLDTGKYIVATDNQLHLVDVSAGEASITSSIAINASDTIDQVSIDALSTTEAALVVRSSARADSIYCYYITESGGTLTVNSEKLIGSVSSELIKVSKNTATSIAIAFKDGADSSKNKVLVANLSGAQFFKAVSLDTFDTAIDTVDLKYIEDNQVLFSDDESLFNLTLDDNTFEVVRTKIGNAKSDGFDGANIAVDVFGVALKSGYNNLTVGDSLLNGSDTEWAYAISDTEVVQLEQTTP